MKKFNLEEAKAGAPIVTRDGRPARLLGEREHPDYPIIAVVKKYHDIEHVYSYNTNGCNLNMDETENDLFMAPTKRVKYANFYFHKKNGFEAGFFYDTEEEANINIIHYDGVSRYIKTIKVEWEE